MYGYPVRQSVSLPPQVAHRVKAMAKTKKTSANRVIVDLIGARLEARAREKKLFFDLADRLTRSSDAAEQKRLKEGDGANIMASAPRAEEGRR